MKNMDDRNAGRAGPCGRNDVSRWRAGALAAALAGTALLAAACGGSPAQTDTFAPGATYAQTLAFAQCMRANGVPNFPNPDRQGNFNNNNPAVQASESNGSAPVGRFGIQVSQQRNVFFQCQSVLPNAGTGLTMTQIQQITEQNLRNAVQAANCMRAHGITNFPDPVASNVNDGGGVSWQPVTSAIKDGALSTSTPSYEAAFLACNDGKVAGGYIPPDFAPGSPPLVSGNGL